MPGALEFAKARARRRRRASGAVMFVIAMSLAVLASLGMYALLAAATEVRMSGNERQNTQTHYLAEYGIVALADQMTAAKAQFYATVMQSNPDFPCVSLPGVKVGDPINVRACHQISSAELSGLSSQWASTITATDAYKGGYPYAPGLTPGSLGPVPTKADFLVELTSPTQVKSAAGYSTDQDICFLELTATSVGVTQPTLSVANGSSTVPIFASEGLEMQRARFISGPIKCAAP